MPYQGASVLLIEAQGDLATSSWVHADQPPENRATMIAESSCVGRAFVGGACVRRLGYDRDQGGWVIVEGEPQSWERA